MLADLNVWNQELKEYTNVNAGQTKVFLNGNCRAGECNLGSFIADSMTRAYNKVRLIFQLNTNCDFLKCLWILDLICNSRLQHARMQRSAIPSKSDVHIGMINSGTVRTNIGYLADNGKYQTKSFRPIYFRYKIPCTLYKVCNITKFRFFYRNPTQYHVSRRNDSTALPKFN